MIDVKYLQQLIDSAQAYATGFSDGASSVAKTVAIKLAEEEKAKTEDAKTTVETNKTTAKASK